MRRTILVAGVLCAVLWIWFGQDPQARVEARFAADLPQLTQTAQALLAGEERSPLRAGGTRPAMGRQSALTAAPGALVPPPPTGESPMRPATALWASRDWI